MRHLVIGQRQKAPNLSAFHWSPHGCLITIGQHFVTTRVVHLPKRTETSLITESDQSRANHQLLQLCMVRTAWSDSDQAVRAVHSCKSWLHILSYTKIRWLSHFVNLNRLKGDNSCTTDTIMTKVNGNHRVITDNIHSFQIS